MRGAGSVRGLLLVGAVVAGGVPSAIAATAMGPVCNEAAKVISTTYYSCTGGAHNGVDIGNVPCGEPLYGPLVGSRRYQSYGGCEDTCAVGTACNGGAGNYYVVTGVSGWDFRMLHATGTAVTVTCDRCRLGSKVGGSGGVVHVHLDNRQYGTRKTAWYSGAGTTCGSSGNCTQVIGYPTL